LIAQIAFTMQTYAHERQALQILLVKQSPGAGALTLWHSATGAQKMDTLWVIILVFLIVGNVPTWPYSPGWGIFRPAASE
jgi:hypothetical protein